MARAIVPTDFFSEAFHTVQSLPMTGYVVAAAFGFLNVAIDLALPDFGNAGLIEFGAMGVLVIVSLSTVYLLSMMIIRVSPSWAGGLRFIGTLVLSVGLALAVLFGGLLLMRIGNAVATATIGVAMILIFVGLPLLSGWPVAQAISNRFVSPITILRATKGHRWGLFIASYASTGINKIFPAADTAKSAGQALLLASGDGAVSCVSVILLASIGATAYRFVARADPSLAVADGAIA